MGARLTLILGLTVCWFWFCNQWMCCWINAACCNEGGGPVGTASVEFQGSPQKPPLRFSFSDPLPVTSESFGKFKDDIVNKEKEGHILKITGIYFEDEKNNSPYNNLGIARAYYIKNLFLDKIPPSRIILNAEKIKQLPESKSKLFEASKLEWIPAGDLTTKRTNND